MLTEHLQSIEDILAPIILLSWVGAFILLICQIIMKSIIGEPEESNSNFSYTPTPSKANNRARKIKHKTRRINCINCNYSLEKSSTDLCPNCGKSVHIKVKLKTCKNCGSDYDNELLNCPICS